MNLLNKVSEVTDKFFKRRVVNFILGKRLCSECAKKEWKNEDKDQELTMLAGICERCHKLGLVAYIEK